MALLGMNMLGGKIAQAQLLALAAKTNIEAVQLGRRLAREMVTLASANCPVASGRLRATIHTTHTGVYTSGAEAGRGVPWTYYAEFYVTKGHEIKAPSGRFWYPSLGNIRKRLKSELGLSGKKIIQVG